MAALMRGMLRFCTLTPTALPGSIQVKRHVRALRRTPVRVIPAGNSATDEKVGVRRPQDHRQERAGPANTKQTITGNTGVKVWTEAKDESSGHAFKYERAVSGDKRLGKVVTIAKSKKFRDRHGQILLEGRRLIMDAMEAGAVLQTIFFSRVDHLKELPPDKLKKANLVKVKFEDIKTWTDVVTPQGLMGIFAMPDRVKMNYPAAQIKNTLPLSLICDNIRDPGNLGTILRCAAGAGCDKVLLTKGCVDAWEPKVLRAGMGAHFRLPIITSLEWDVVPNYLPAGTKVFVADNFKPNNCNEAAATSEKASDYGWVSTHPRRISHLEEDTDFSSDEEESDENELYIPDIPVQSYHERWARNPSALVIGGETHGLSLESLLVVDKSDGRRLFIPVVPGIDSLNSAMAASIILFEGKRQLQALKNS
ncbi:rRNA methyltransferase 3, mitochondrial [Rhinophrynus dorsalis]